MGCIFSKTRKVSREAEPIELPRGSLTEARSRLPLFPTSQKAEKYKHVPIESKGNTPAGQASQDASIAAKVPASAPETPSNALNKSLLKDEASTASEPLGRKLSFKIKGLNVEEQVYTPTKFKLKITPPVTPRKTSTGSAEGSQPNTPKASVKPKEASAAPAPAPEPEPAPAKEEAGQPAKEATVPAPNPSKAKRMSVDLHLGDKVREKLEESQKAEVEEREAKAKLNEGEGEKKEDENANPAEPEKEGGEGDALSAEERKKLRNKKKNAKKRAAKKRKKAAEKAAN